SFVAFSTEVIRVPPAMPAGASPSTAADSGRNGGSSLSGGPTTMTTTTHIREALDILLDQIVQSADEDERRELSRAVKALNEAMMAIGDARHRTDPRKEFVPYPV